MVCPILLSIWWDWHDEIFMGFWLLQKIASKSETFLIAPTNGQMRWVLAVTNKKETPDLTKEIGTKMWD